MMNLKNLLTLLAICFAAVFFTSCEKEPEPKKIPSPPNKPEGVVINGIRWATCNVGAQGAFVLNPEAQGNFYAWEDAPDACPDFDGWRLPTDAELASLADAPSEWVSVNGVKGRVFGNDTNIIFLPAAAYRSYGGTTGDVGYVGHYWSSTEANEPLAYYLNFNSAGVFPPDVRKPDSRRNRAFEFSIRCVTDVDLTPIPIPNPEPEPEPEPDEE